MKHGLGLDKALGAIHAYPTMAEANKFVAGMWEKAATGFACAVGEVLRRAEIV